MKYTRKDNKILPLAKGEIKEDLYVLYPVRFHAPNVLLANNDGVFGSCIVSNSKGEYMLLCMPVKLSFNPVEIGEETIEGKLYKKLKVLKGTKLFKIQKFIPSLDDVYSLLDDWLIRNGNIPFYMGVSDLLRLFTKSATMVGGTIAKDIVAISILISIIARDKDGGYIRIKGKEFIEREDSGLRFVGLSDKNEGSKNIMSQISRGTHLEQGIDAALLLEEEDDTEYGKVFSS